MPISKPPYRLPILLQFTVLLSIFAYLYAVPIWDADFWWHIAAGRWIWINQTLPIADPFNVFDNVDSIRSKTVLQGQWLGQQLLYGLFQLGGVNAVVSWRVAVLCLCLTLIYKRSWIHGTSPILFPMLMAAGFCLFGYTGDRPQLMSILAAALLFWLVDSAEKYNSPVRYIAIPLLGLVWANSHGAVILGLVMLAAYAIIWWLQAWLGYDHAPNLRRSYTLAVFAFALATLITPNGIATYLYVFDLQGSELQQRTSEYVSSLLLYQQGHLILQLWVGMILVATLVSLISLFRHDPRRAVVVTGLTLISLESFRYFVFTLVVALPYVYTGLNELWRRRFAITQRPTISVTTVIIITALLTLWVYPTQPRGGVNTERYPIQLVEQLQGQQGYIFNWMRWGGYLLWEIPSLTPFIDGRMLDDQRLLPYTHILWATKQGQQWFHRDLFDWVLLPAISPTGKRYGLHNYLRQQSDWQIIASNREGELYRRRQ